ncbi:MAG TPA: C39 family peptidase [Magnetospirillum sp.]|nr:C39 family peptidase [Magnetospirillum sp.]
MPPHRAVFFVAALLVAPDFAGASDGAKRVVSLAEQRNAQVVRQHWDLSCGAAAIATLLTYQFDDPVSEYAVANELLARTNPLKVRERLGFSLLDLKRFAQSHGYVAAGYGGLDLDEAVADAPAIVPIQAKGYDHFVVLRGRLDNRIVLADPAYGNRTLTIDQFLAIWPNRIAFVLHRPDGSAGGPGLAARADLLLVPTDSAVRAAELGARREIHP